MSYEDVKIAEIECLDIMRERCSDEDHLANCINAADIAVLFMKKVRADVLAMKMSKFIRPE